LIGLCTALEQAQFSVWDIDVTLLDRRYSEAVQQAGGVAVLLPPDAAAIEDPDAVLDALDGLILAGGRDVDPVLYGAAPHQDTDEPRTERDRFEIALARRAMERDIPVLGICRGMQVMAVHAGGLLDQHVPDLVAHDEHSPGGDAFGSIEVSTTAGSRLASLVGDRLAVTCHHHQSVRSHPGYDAVARAADGTLEAMERGGERFCVGVQWHPETATDVGLVAGLVRAAAAYAEDR
jgi:putative glutamine amidotransferase